MSWGDKNAKSEIDVKVMQIFKHLIVKFLGLNDKEQNRDLRMKLKILHLQLS